MDVMNAMEMQQKMMAHIMAPADSTLSKLFTPEQLDSVGALLSSYVGQPVDMMQMDPMKPVMVTTQLVLLQSIKAFPGFNPAVQLDATVQNMGKAGGKKVDGLETLEFQMSVLYDTPLREQADDLMESVRNDSTSVVKAGRLAEAYTSGDLAKIDELMYDSDEMTPAKLERLLLQRNRDWAGKLPAIMKEQPAMIVVGCGHLPGKEGVIELLRAQGYTLTPVDK
ncbi:MAG: TraB/GumN family protein [Paramuribaculum sp.]|nr:TraB/GumN family protein [Paramuribaculum sp.]